MAPKESLIKTMSMIISSGHYRRCKPLTSHTAFDFHTNLALSFTRSASGQGEQFIDVFISASKVCYILRIFKCLNFSLSSSQIAYLTSGIRPGKAKTFMTEALIMSQLSEMRILRQPVDHQVCCVLHADSRNLQD